MAHARKEGALGPVGRLRFLSLAAVLHVGEGHQYEEQQTRAYAHELRRQLMTPAVPAFPRQAGANQRFQLAANIPDLVHLLFPVIRADSLESLFRPALGFETDRVGKFHEFRIHRFSQARVIGPQLKLRFGLAPQVFHLAGNRRPRDNVGFKIRLKSRQQIPSFSGLCVFQAGKHGIDLAEFAEGSDDGILACTRGAPVPPAKKTNHDNRPQRE